MLQNVPHQLLQSPAWLSLPTPSSPSLHRPPKFSSPVSQPQQPHQQANVLAASITSSKLLQLLPPLSRAQSLLIQMSSLASRLFGVSPNRPHWLSAFADLDVGIPKTDEGKEKIIESLIEPPAEITALANLPIQELIPFVVPSGWRPGMPDELPTDLPVPPPGWKPGHPIALPPVGSLQLPLKIEEAPAQPVPPRGLPRAPEPIQVQHVQLDIEDYSSDYSSDEASSDSED